MSSEELRQIYAKDGTSFDLLYDHFAKTIYGIIATWFSSSDVQNELLQKTFISIWNQLDDFKDSKEPLLTHIIRETRNQCIKEKSTADSNTNVSFVKLLHEREELPENIDQIGIQTFIKKLRPKNIKLIQSILFAGKKPSNIAHDEGKNVRQIKSNLRESSLEIKSIFHLK